jgi:hypothetical protein
VNGVKRFRVTQKAGTKYNAPNIQLVTCNTLVGVNACNAHRIYQLSSRLLNTIMNFWYNIMREFVEQVSSCVLLRQNSASCS